MAERNLPDLGRLSSQLAEHNRRLTNYIDALPGRMDKLVEAALDKDWPELRRQTDYLACSSIVFGCPEMTQAAQRVATEAGKPANDLAIKRSLIRLLARCGSFKPSSVAAPSRA